MSDKDLFIGHGSVGVSTVVIARAVGAYWDALGAWRIPEELRGSLTEDLQYRLWDALISGTLPIMVSEAMVAARPCLCAYANYVNQDCPVHGGQA